MRTIETIIKAEVCLFDELPSGVQALFAVAVRARKCAQAPYSRFKVGVALEGCLPDLVYRGCNVERVSYTQTTHAEQNAVDTMVAEGRGPRKILRIALVAGPEDQEIILPPRLTGEPATFFSDIPVPCGHCLQIIWENCFGDKGVPLYALAGSGEVVKVAIGDALPFAFGPEALGIRYG